MTEPGGQQHRTILALNAGSSSIKFAVFSSGEMRCLSSGEAGGIGSGAYFQSGGTKLDKTIEATADHGRAIDVILDYLDQAGLFESLDGIGHRIVHGGTKFIRPVLVDDSVEADLDRLRRLAPLHMPPCLDVLRKTRQRVPGIRNFACFDTAFHATQPDLATRLPIPRAYHERGYRRYGFHGLNYEHVVAALPKATGKPLPRRLLVAHLGSGASMCAILDGKSVATTMGYSTADGLIMGTRTGSIDPGVILALMRDDHMDGAGLEELLYRRGGLLGLSGISADMRVLLANGTPEAQEAVASYCYSAARHAASLVAAMGGIDAIVFTGGIGENAAPVRARILDYLAWLGLAGSQIHIVAANEELAIARHVAALLVMN